MEIEANTSSLKEHEQNPEISLGHICTLTKGAQDVKLEEINGRKLLYQSVLETRTHECSGEYTIVLDLQEPYTGISNVRIDGDWEKCHIEIGCNIVERIHKISGENTFMGLSNGSCFPLLEHDKIHLRMCGTTYTVKYDIVTIDRMMLEYSEFFIKQNHCNEFVPLQSGQNNNLIWFNHPIEKLRVISEYPIEDLTLSLFEYTFNFTNINDLTWEFAFEPTLNFSRIDKIRILCNNAFEGNLLHVFATSHHIIKFLNGRAGLEFTK